MTAFDNAIGLLLRMLEGLNQPILIFFSEQLFNHPLLLMHILVFREILACGNKFSSAVDLFGAEGRRPSSHLDIMHYLLVLVVILLHLFILNMLFMQIKVNLLLSRYIHLLHHGSVILFICLNFVRANALEIIVV